MCTPNSSATYKVQSLVKVLYRYRISATNLHREPLYRGGSNLPSKYFNYAQYSSNIHDGLKSIPPNSGITSKPMADMVKEGIDKVQPSVPPPRKPIFPAWVKWLFGSVLSLLLPLWKFKWGSLLLLEENVEEVVEEVEIAAEAVEKVATTAEKVSAVVADKLPDNGQLKAAALAVEHISSVAATDAELAEDFIQKVEKLKNDLTDLGTMVEPVIDKIVPKEHGGN
ncbi:hypothetical protein RHSIM_Rhsim05G0103200 [Rhododendron simsii]|uniref:Uncharacterized protein n=1 Tax=Rhododendron simsii TaxID=118357 RepID=A0A834H8A9_RHOSS|nr:hypothetical protein RHSIM_Rhsim05G0103200 [Rhododendron simsii]